MVAGPDTTRKDACAQAAEVYRKAARALRADADACPDEGRYAQAADAYVTVARLYADLGDFRRVAAA